MEVGNDQKTTPIEFGVSMSKVKHTVTLKVKTLSDQYLENTLTQDLLTWYGEWS